MKSWLIMFAAWLATPVHAITGVGEAVPIYTEDQLSAWFTTNQHLAQVKADDCQLVQDIQARAEQIESPAYQFLYGDMLAWGVCVPKDVAQGLYYMRAAAQQGVPVALEQLGRYYAQGVILQQDKQRAIPYLREAAALGNVRARIQLAQLLIADNGSPLDYEDAYRWLYQTVTTEKGQYQQIRQLRQQLEKKMPANIIARAKRRSSFW
ncbi:flagellar protein MotX [Photobacterium phosphoreum]|uniref:Flagellar protein MotX n=1 Tax=Photobacterium phosphoreum TaxID=659 RepID=A0A2T3JEE2_PHOPO|nr:SEL1-like repeat protein [Photobacterium phosphoreum]MCD9472768.1 flagellar protein MotX [Photobacterium phosphoreum]MCD9481293.1 flagellar protein MotX [Photobacterium phosphoreum]MCD9520664.1 flagellar protein MotX [Photobacterium phosphoreum]PSU21097.1 flagellar protein MotX [Photobacterium phosphoreum]PSU34505.1 flagellar protein MotX [Photobacterium phosphoreum]